MVKRYKDVEVPAKVEQREIGANCDKCGCEIPDEKMYESVDFELEFMAGDNYPDFQDWRGWKLEDLCDPCVAALRTLLEDNGFTTVDKEYTN